MIGTSGSGKTTFSRQLAEILHIPFIEMDAIFWGPDWSPLEDEDLYSRLAESLEGDKWVLDGNYTRTTAIKWERVEVVVWLDFCFPRTLSQAISRAVQRLLSNQEIWPGTGNRETLRKLFSKDSIVLWTITSYRRKRKNIIEMMGDQEYRHIQFHRLCSPAETAKYLDAVHQNPIALYTGAAALE